MAPIALFVYNRPDHTRLTLQCLAAADGAAMSDLYIFADGPRVPDDSDAAGKVRELCREPQLFTIH